MDPGGGVAGTAAVGGSLLFDRWVLLLRRWCTRQIQGEMALHPKLLRDDRLATYGIRAPGRQHPVQHRLSTPERKCIGVPE